MLNGCKLPCCAHAFIGMRCNISSISAQTSIQQECFGKQSFNFTVLLGDGQADKAQYKYIIPRKTVCLLKC
eukprot:m.18251 g.18251  ORF g.18251 m.18251 type:complete len:71 (+) comp11407_c0_seq2:1860-2072(+)